MKTICKPGTERMAATIAVALLGMSITLVAAAAEPLAPAPTRIDPTRLGTSAGSVMISVGGQAVYQDLKIEFLGVASDTRCPAGTTCNTPGNAAVQLRVTQTSSVAKNMIPLTLNTAIAPQTGSVGDWRIGIKSLLPALTASVPKADPKSYQVALTITRSLTAPTPTAGTRTEPAPLSPTSSGAAPLPVGPLTIAYGKTAIYGDLHVEFVAVLEDSRCPRGATCVQAGNAKVRIRVGKANMSPVDTELNSSTAPTSVTTAGHLVKFVSLTPMPTLEGKPSPGMYQLTLDIK